MKQYKTLRGNVYSASTSFPGYRQMKPLEIIAKEVKCRTPHSCCICKYRIAKGELVLKTEQRVRDFIHTNYYCSECYTRQR